MTDREWLDMNTHPMRWPADFSNKHDKRQGEAK